MFAIFKREFKSYFNTVIGFLFLAVNIFIVGLYISFYNLAYGYSSMMYGMYSPIIIILIAIAVLSMKVFSEERKQKTDQLILTSPVSVTKIVLGKYLAMAAVYTIEVAFFCLIPVYLNKFGDVPMKENYTIILAFALYGYAAIAIGMFVSSITQTQVISAVITFLILLVSYMMTSITGLLPEKLSKVGDVLDSLCMGTKYINMLQGTFDLNSVVFFLTVIVLMIYFTIQSIQKRRYTISSKSISLSSYNMIMVVAVAAVAVVINLVVNELPDKYTQIDVTTNKIYTVSDDAINFIEGIEDDVTIYMTCLEDESNEVVNKTIKKMADYNSKIKIEYVDLTVNPKFYTKYTEDSKGVSAGDLIIDGGKLSKIISQDDLFEYEVDYQTYTQSITGYDIQGQVVSALDYVTGGKQPQIYYTKGHSEIELDTNFLEMLEKSNIKCDALTLLSADKVPEDASCVIINCPQSDFSDNDVTKIEDYVKAGGNLFINMNVSDLDNVNKILDLYSTQVTGRYVVDNDSAHFIQTPLYLIPDVTSSDYSGGMDDKYVFLPYANEISTKESDDVTFTEFLSTSEDSYAQGVDESGKGLAGEKVEGPLCIGVAATRTFDDNTSTAIIYSCADFLTNNADAMVSEGNQSLFKANITSIVPEASGKVSVPVISDESEMLTTTEEDIMLFRLIIDMIIPLVLLLTGIGVWISRRRR